MKKFLSLVLALVMTMSLVTISAGAKFTDADDINYAEAVEVMTKIGVVGGYADGSFNPTAGLTRGAAAKIICNMILGPTTAGALAANEAPFVDVPANSTFAGYIAYCVNEGIISGYADGTFKPAAPLSGYAFMKMLLGALGYDAANEGYVGANWAIAVAKRALNIGLDDGLDGSFYGVKALTREEACLYAFNALKADMVEYENDSKITVGDIVVSNSSKAEVITNVKNAGKIWDEGTTEVLQFAEKYFEKLSFVPGTDSFGRPAITWWYGVKNDDNKIGQFVTEDPIATFTGVTSEKEVYDAIGGSGADELIAEIYEDGSLKAGYAYVKANTTNAPYFGNGVNVEIYDVTPDDAAAPVYRLVAIRDYLGTVTGVNKANEKTDTKRSINIKLDVVPSGMETSTACEKYETEDFAKKDVVVVNVSTMDGKIKVKSAALAEKLEDVAINSYKKGGMDAGYVVIEGEKTAYSQNFNEDSDTKTYVLKDTTYTFYMDSYGNILKVKVYEGVSEDYLQVVAKGAADKDDGFGGDKYREYKVVNLEGKVSVVKALNKNADTAAVGDIITMKDDDDNEGYKKFDVITTTYDAEKAYQTSTALVTVGTTKPSFDKNIAYVNNTIAVNNKTIFVLKVDTNEYEVVNGLANMDSYKELGDQVVKAIVKKGVAQVVYMDVSAATASTSVDNLVYILSNKYSESYDSTNKCSVYTYSAIVDGEVTTIDTKDATVSVGLNKIEKMSDGYVADNGMAVVSGAKYTVLPVSGKVTFEDGVLNIAGAGKVVTTDVDVTTIIGTDNEVTFEAGAEALAGDVVNGVFYLVATSTTNATVATIYFDGTID